MNKALSRLKQLSQRAAELQAAIQRVPPKVAEVRETVAATTGQLMQLKGEFRQSVAGLRTESETGLSQAVQEINQSAEIFAQAGYLISGVDLELSPAQRVLVRLAKADEVPLAEISSLAAANRGRRTTHAILIALIQAEQMADSIRLPGLEYHDLVVGVGMMPSVRMGWRDASVSQDALVSALKTATAPATPATPAGSGTPMPAASSMFGAGSFFERRTAEPAPAATAPKPAAEPAAAETTPVVAPTSKPSVLSPAPTAPKPAAPGEHQDPLARFKRMPDLTRPAH